MGVFKGRATDPAGHACADGGRRFTGARGSRGPLVAAAVLVVSVLVALGGTTAPSYGAGCLTRLPVNVTLPSGFAAAYHANIPVAVSSNGPTIRNLRAAIYTFSGDQIAATRQTTGRLSSGTLNLRLAFGPLQQGAYTLVLTGEPNASPSCGPKKFITVVRFRGCLTQLPLRFVSPPGGAASDYDGYLSATLQSTGPLVRDLEGAVYDAEGTLFGEGTLTALYGQTSLNMKLNRPLVPGVYTVVVAGLIEQPRSCGPKTAQVDLQFE